MTIAELSDLFLNWIITYGGPVLAVALFTGALGIPLPGTLFVIAAGAFVRQDVLGLTPTLSLALFGVVVGDVLSYGMGRGAQGLVERRFAQTKSWGQATEQFRRRGGTAVYLSRWLITPIAVPVNLVAGTSGYRFANFLAFDVAGELTWLLLYGGLGYLFGSQWEVISTFVSDFSGVLAGVAIVFFGLWLYLRPKPKA